MYSKFNLSNKIPICGCTNVHDDIKCFHGGFLWQNGQPVAVINGIECKTYSSKTKTKRNETIRF